MNCHLTLLQKLKNNSDSKIDTLQQYSSYANQGIMSLTKSAVYSISVDPMLRMRVKH
jgi:hypothetical protein